MGFDMGRMDPTAVVKTPSTNIVQPVHYMFPDSTYGGKVHHDKTRSHPSSPRYHRMISLQLFNNNEKDVCVIIITAIM